MDLKIHMVGAVWPWNRSFGMIHLLEDLVF